MKEKLSTGKNSAINENLNFINFEELDLLCYRKLDSMLGKLPVRSCNLELIGWCSALYMDSINDKYLL